MRYPRVEDIENVLAMSLLATRLNDVASKLDEGNKYKETVKNCRMARTYGKKAVDSYMRELNPWSRDYIFKEVDKYDLAIKYTKNAEAERKRQAKLEHNRIVDNTTLAIIVGQGMASCDVCESVGEEVEKCPVKHAYLVVGLGAINPDADSKTGGCPFRIRVINEEV